MSVPPPSSPRAEPAGAARSDGDPDPAAAGEVTPALSDPARATPPRRTRTGAAWVGISIAVLIIILLIVFIAQNTQNAKISFLWLSGNFPVGLALLVAAVAGALIAVVTGSARILQLRQAMAHRRGGGKHHRR